MSIQNNNSVYIPSIDGKDIFISNHLEHDTTGYRLRLRTGKYNLGKFINTLDFSLDLIKLREVYQKVYRRNDFSFWDRNKEYSPKVINVTFKYSNKEYNKVKPDTYVKFGYSATDRDFDDCLYIKNGELIGIKTNCPVYSPAPGNILGKYFRYEQGVYKASDNIKTLHSVSDIRSELYSNGFICDGIKYVRFKRSSGASRVGKCLFIDEKLYSRMHKWEMCGIKVKNGQDIDLASLEPYIALTLSSIIDTIQIKPENILVVDDYKSVFKDRVVATRLIDNKLSSKVEDVELSNSIWDGQSLMDKSLFGKYENKGMLLLRSRFFKSCCFNTNLQQWFQDNHISDVNQLNGFTKATKIEDVKLITTPSSIKYLKFGTLDKWLEEIESTFGVVKHEKPTHFFDGRMVQTHYQLLNTLQMTKQEVEDFIAPSLSYAKMIKTDPVVLRHQIGYQYHTPDTLFYDKSITSKNDIIYKMLGINEHFAETKIYQQFRDDLVKSFIKNLRCGHVLVHGNYSTLCGNPIEMLKQAIGKFDGISVIEKGTIHSVNFPDNAEILGSRSPHVTVGNVLLTKNIHRPDITRYMNASNEIVYVNSINENLLERLSGSDFDSDTLLLTDNEILVKAAKRNYALFPVPTKLIDGEKHNRKYTSEEQADLDVKTSVNKIGEIINLSQELNSLLWDKLNSGETIENVMELYCDIAQLDVMSNLEIDAAKKENPANNVLELKRLKKKYDKRDNKDRHIRPLFFKYIDSYKGYREKYYVYEAKNEDEYKKYCTMDKYTDVLALKKQDEARFKVEKGRMSYVLYQTTMDYLQKSINKFRSIRLSKKRTIPFSECLISAENLPGRVRTYQVEKIIELVRETKKEIWYIWNTESDLDNIQKRRLAEESRQKCIKEITSIPLGIRTMRYLLSILDQKEYSDISRLLFTILLETKNNQFYELIKKSKTPICKLEESEQGDIKIYDFQYKQLELN